MQGIDDWIEHNRESIDVGDYKLLRSIGTGAFGTVWEANNFETGEFVAIKFLTAGDLKWEAMLAEVRFLQTMEGTGGIVTVKQVRRGTPTQPPYYVMPKANGGSLADWMAEQRRELGSYAYAADLRQVDRSGALDGMTLEYLTGAGACVLGTPDECIAICERYREAGVDLLLCLVNPYRIPHEAVLETIDLMGRHVIPHFQR